MVMAKEVSLYMAAPFPMRISGLNTHMLVMCTNSVN